MANPQREDGHIDIANEIAEALAKIHLSSYESQVLWAIFRKTYGWHKKEDWITNTQIANITGIAESHISRTIKILIQKNLIIKNGKKLGFQKDYDQWVKLPKGVTSHHEKKLPKGDIKLPKGVIKVTKGGIKKLPKGVDTKETKRNYTNKTIQKKKLFFNFIKKEFTNLTKEEMEEFDEKYPGVEIDQEIEKMENWLIKEKEKRDNGEKNKIPKDYSKFINNWLKKEEQQ